MNVLIARESAPGTHPCSVNEFARGTGPKINGGAVGERKEAPQLHVRPPALHGLCRRSREQQREGNLTMLRRVAFDDLGGLQ